MLKILVIDDEETVLDSISLVLKNAGYQVVKARNGEEGIRIFDQYSFDIVITDFFMPVCNGNQVAKYIRNNRKTTPVIGITGTPEEADFSCFDIVLKKPFSLKKLIEHINILKTSE